MLDLMGFVGVWKLAAAVMIFAECILITHLLPLDEEV